MQSSGPDTSVVDAATGTASLDGAEPAPADAVARLISLDEGFYAFTMVGDAAWGGIAPGFTVPAVHISAPPDRFGALEVTDVFGQPAEWMGARHATVLVKTPTGGGVALVTAYPARDPERPPLKLEIRRLDATGFLAAAEKARPDDLPARQPPFATVFLADPIATPASTEEVPVEIVLHVRGRGDVRFVDVPWAGRLAPGLWIESFTILPRHRFAEAAIEYKGLTATGMEPTGWSAALFAAHAARTRRLSASRCGPRRLPEAPASIANTAATFNPEHLSGRAAMAPLVYPRRQTIRSRESSCGSSDSGSGQRLRRADAYPTSEAVSASIIYSRNIQQIDEIGAAELVWRLRILS